MQTSYSKWVFLGLALLSFSVQTVAAETQQAAGTKKVAGSKKVVKPKPAEPEKPAEPVKAIDPASLQQDSEAAEKAYLKGDIITAIALWEKAAKQGYAPAQARLGDMMDAAEEDSVAVKWYQEAAKTGNAAGEYGLGVMYLKGEGVAKDIEKGYLLILQAANKDYAPAMKLMVEYYRTGQAGLPADPEQAGIWEDRMYAVMGVSKPAASAPAANVEKKK